MLLSCKFNGKSANQKGGNGLTVYNAIANTPALDRDNEVLLPRGAITEDFMKNPVMLMIHNYRAVPVGKVLKLDVDEERIKFDFTFADTKMVQEELELPKLYEEGMMNAFSVGFYPKARVQVDDEMTGKIEVELPDGGKQEIDLDKYENNPDTIYNKWELLEISPVPVPANPEALLLRTMENIKKKSIEVMPMAKSFIEETFEKKKEAFVEMLKDFTKDIKSIDLGAVATHSTPVNEEISWDGGRARAELAKWASSDGSGDKEKINWAKYSKGFTWFDEAKADNFAAYKLPHHTIQDGKLIAVWRGVTAAMAVLLGARGGVDLPDTDKRKVYDHLAKHYRDAEKEPPEFRDYESSDLEGIENGTFEVGKDQPGTISGDDDDKNGNVPEIKVLEDLKDIVEEGLSELGIRLSMVQDGIEAIDGKLTVSGEQSGNDDSDEEKKITRMKSVLTGFVETKK